MKKILALLVVLIVSIFGFKALAYSQFAGGSGTEDDPFIVLNAIHLNNVRNFPDKYFRQDADIDFSIPPNNTITNWNPIGGNGSSLRFTGHYDGNGNEIKNLTILRAAMPNVGLFGHIGLENDGATTIKNLGLNNVYVAGGRGTGALVGRVTGNQNTRIENCYVYLGIVSGDGATGGLVGSNNSYINNSGASESFRPVINKSWARVQVLLRTITATGKDKFGGLVGCNQKGLISNSYSRGSVFVPGGTRIGGLAGCVELRGIIINSYSTGAVNVSDSISLVGGLVGMKGISGNAGTVTNSYWNITTSGQATSAGGIGLTTELMNEPSSYVSWDFNSTWQIVEGENEMYPVLINMFNPGKVWVWSPVDNSNQWNNPINWNLQSVPPSGSVVMIPFSAGSYPLLSHNESLHLLIMGSNTELMLDNNSTLTITGQLKSDQIAASISGEGSLKMSGSTTQNLSNLKFYNLTVDNLNNLRLEGDIHVNGLLHMENGLLDLNGFHIFMGDNAQIKEFESVNSSSRIFGSSGYIEMVRELNNPSGEISGIGLEIETSQNLGTTIIRRGHGELNFSDDSRSILRWFDIIPENNENLDATITFHYFIGELNLYDESTNFSLFKSDSHDYYSGNEWIWVPSEVYAADKRIIAYEVESFSLWTAGNSDNPLPISLLSFHVKQQNNVEVLIEWATASEINNDFFTLERSKDGISWDVLTFVNGSGTISQSKYYSATDTDPYSGTSYYRLKQTDFDGTFEYFSPVSIHIERNTEERFTLYPNPNNGNFRIDYQGDQDVEIRIFDMQGRMIHSKLLGARNINSVNLPQLPAGLYNVVFYSDEVVAQKMLIR